MLIERAISRIETETRENADYLRDVARESSAAFLKFLLMMPMANHRREAPKEAWHGVRLVATQHEDCGPCVQIVVNMALADNVDAALLRDVLEADWTNLPAEVAAACRLAEASVNGSERAAVESAEVAKLLGQEALVELAFAIATARVFPSLKRSLGYARSCSLTSVSCGQQDRLRKRRDSRAL